VVPKLRQKSHPKAIAPRAKPRTKGEQKSAKTDRTFNPVHSTLSHENSSSQNHAGIKKCNKCSTCYYLQEGQTDYTFFTTKEARKITDSISCRSKNLIYLIECKKCSLQYIGQTARQLNRRFWEHLRDIKHRNNSSVSLHFNQADHSINDVRLIPIELIDDYSERMAREVYLIKKETLYPFGLNRKAR